MDAKKERAAKRILLAMAKKGMRQAEVAETTGIPKSSISHYSNGKRIPDFENACKISKVLGTAPEFLMVEEDLGFMVVEDNELQHLIKEMNEDMLARLTAYAQAITDMQRKEKTDGEV